MNNPANPMTDIAALVGLQRQHCLREPYPSLATRRDRLDRAIALLRGHKEAIARALDRDYGSRSRFQSIVLDVLIPLESLKYCRRHTGAWMKPERRGAKFPLNLCGARAEVFYQPLGVVGIVSPWNFPVQLSFSPLANALAAGNRALIKPSELTPETSALMQRLVAEYFDPAEVAVVTGGREVGEAFTRQPFDHLVFTGAPAVAREVMRAAADHLVPLTLELGGKCPVVIGSGADLASAVLRTLVFKTANAGQICLAPDYAFVPEALMDDFVTRCRAFVAKSYPGLATNSDYCSLIDGRNLERLNRYLDEAAARGARLIPLADSPAGQPVASNKLAPTLVIDPPLDTACLREEIFGPLFPVRTYRAMDEVITHINGGERPLAIYYFGTSKSEIAAFKTGTTSGGMVVNDIAAHVLQDTMPLGGVGHSGMGSYHGFDGFRQLSHAKAFYKQGLLSLTPLFKAPHSARLLALLEKVMG